jgi:hypothetical protein
VYSLVSLSFVYIHELITTVSIPVYGYTLGHLSNFQFLFHLFIYLFILFVCFTVLRFKLGASHLLGRCSTAWWPPALFFWLFLKQGLQTFCLGWPGTIILLISTSCSYCDRHTPLPRLRCGLMKVLSKLTLNLDPLILCL